MAYRYGDQAYRAVISGQDAARVTGKAPYSWLKILSLVAIGVAILALIAYAIFGSP